MLLRRTREEGKVANLGEKSTTGFDFAASPGRDTMQASALSLIGKRSHEASTRRTERSTGRDETAVPPQEEESSSPISPFPHDSRSSDSVDRTSHIGSQTAIPKPIRMPSSSSADGFMVSADTSAAGGMAPKGVGRGAMTPKWFAFFGRRKSQQQLVKGESAAAAATAVDVAYHGGNITGNQCDTDDRGTSIATTVDSVAQAERNSPTRARQGRDDMAQESGLEEDRTSGTPNDIAAEGSNCRTAPDVARSSRRSGPPSYTAGPLEVKNPENADSASAVRGASTSDSTSQTSRHQGVRMVLSSSPSSSKPTASSMPSSSSPAHVEPPRAATGPPAECLKMVASNRQRHDDDDDHPRTEVKLMSDSSRGDSDLQPMKRGAHAGSRGDGTSALSTTRDVPRKVSSESGVGNGSIVAGMRVLCLDIFHSRIGGGEIRRWRPAEVEEVYMGTSGKEMVRLVFACYADEKQSLCLCLKEEWRRLATSLSLTEEEMSSGSPLQGEALAASKKQFKPRSSRRKYRSGPTGAGATASTSQGARTAEGSMEALRAGGTREVGRKVGSKGSSSGVGIGKACPSDKEGSNANLDDAASGSVVDRCRQRRGDGQSKREQSGRHAAGDVTRGTRSAGSGEVDGSSSGGTVVEQTLDTEAVAAALAKALETTESDGNSSATAGNSATAAVAAAALAAALAAKDSDSSCGGGLAGAGTKARGAESFARGRRSDMTHGVAPTASASSPSSSSSRKRSAKKAAGTEVEDGRRGNRQQGLHRGEGSGKGGGEIIGREGAASLAADRYTPMSPLYSGKARDNLAIPIGAGGSIGMVGQDQEGPRSGGEREVVDGEERRTGGDGSEKTSSGRIKRPWSVWDLTKQPAPGDRFDCLDYFLSSQSGLDVMKWREAEVVMVRHGPQGTDLLVHFLRWSQKWDRWVSLTHEPDRFAPFMSRAMQVTEIVPPAIAAEYQARRSSLGGSSTSSTALMTNSSTNSSLALNANGFGDVARPALSYSQSERISQHSRSAQQQGARMRHPRSPCPGVRNASGQGQYRAGFANGRCSPTDSQDSQGSLDAVFREAMRRKGLSVVDVEPDGNCLFRSVCHQIYGDAERHQQVRKACVDHMAKHKARFGVFVAEDFRDYLFRIRQPGVWGDDLEIRALEELFDRPIEIYSSEAEDLRPMKIDFDASGLGMEAAPIKLSYHGQSHYNSVRDHSFRYPLQPRRSRDILHMREAQHARTPRSSSANRPQGSRAGGGLAKEASSHRSGKESRFGANRESSTGFGGSSRGSVGKWGPGSSAKVGGGVRGDKGSGAKNFAGVAFRTLFGGVSGRTSA